MNVRSWTLRHWVIAVYGAIGVGLFPWTIWLSASLKPDHRTRHWDIAWSGFDIALALAFLLTALAAWRRSPWVGALSAATGTLLVTDAWFDVVLESQSDDIRNAVVLAVVAELPIAVLCFWIAYRTERFLALIVHAAYGAGAVSHLTAAGQRAAKGDLIGVLEVTPDGEPAGEPGHPDTPA
jgi:hypothetical protein